MEGGENVQADYMFSGVRGSETLAEDSTFQKSIQALQKEALEQWKADVRKSATLVPHTVATGDTLYALAKRYRTSVPVIMTYNDLKNVQLSVGQQLKIPRPK